MADGCEQCGACCEILPLKVLGKECEHYDKETKKCKIYNKRPVICRVTDWKLNKPYCKVLQEMRG